MAKYGKFVFVINWYINALGQEIKWNLSKKGNRDLQLTAFWADVSSTLNASHMCVQQSLFTIVEQSLKQPFGSWCLQYFIQP